MQLSPDFAGSFYAGFNGARNMLAQPTAPESQTRRNNALAAFGGPTRAAAQSLALKPRQSEGNPASDVISGLLARGLTAPAAYGVAGNMKIESDGFKTDVNEYAPLVPGSRGGYGLNQWTGPRRRQFEAFAAERGADPSDLDTQLDFTIWELQNTEQRAGNALLQARTPEEAARIYSEQFLRPGIPHLDRRIAAARQLAQQGYTPASASPASAQPFPLRSFLKNL